MTETIEEHGGFDRRSLIKKGLVIGGAATVLPVISTFNAPAFAASPPPPTFRVHYNITLGLAVLTLSIDLSTRNAGGAPSACPAILPAWTAAAADPGTPAISIDAEAVSIVAGTITFTLPPASGYIFVNGAHGAAACDAPTGLGTNAVTFPLNLLALELITQFWFVITHP